MYILFWIQQKKHFFNIPNNLKYTASKMYMKQPPNSQQHNVIDAIQKEQSGPQNTVKLTEEQGNSKQTDSSKLGNTQATVTKSTPKENGVGNTTNENG